MSNSVEKMLEKSYPGHRKFQLTDGRKVAVYAPTLTSVAVCSIWGFPQNPLLPICALPPGTVCE